MHLSRPLVVVTAATEIIRDQPRVRVNQAYSDALDRAGMIPLVVPPLDPALAASLVARMDGVVLTGGEDVDARQYGQAPHPEAEAPNPARDQWERALVLAARDHQLPVLAICRGMQVANVALGGTLVQDIASQLAGATVHTRQDVRTQRVHGVELEAGCRLAAAIGDTRITVNSLHHQSVDAPGAGLRITARADDGVVEGMEWEDDDWWMLGVQWHPEELDGTREPWDRALFAAFAASVSSPTATASRPAPGA
jgi:putative glutamine amidotransferase